MRPTIDDEDGRTQCVFIVGIILACSRARLFSSAFERIGRYRNKYIYIYIYIYIKCDRVGRVNYIGAGRLHGNRAYGGSRIVKNWAS